MKKSEKEVDLSLANEEVVNEVKIEEIPVKKKPLVKIDLFEDMSLKRKLTPINEVKYKPKPVSVVIDL